MKKIYLLMLFLLGIFISTNAQVIELIGTGMVGQYPDAVNLPITNPGNIDMITLGALYKAEPANMADGSVTFADADEGPSSTWNDVSNIVDKAPFNTNDNIGFWSESFTTADAGGINIVITDVDDAPYVRAAYAYLYRTDPAAAYKSYLSFQTVFFYLNGSGPDNGQEGVYVYTVPIDAAAGSRDITVQIPVAELDNTARNIVFDITAGTVTLHAEETTWNNGESLFIGTYTLLDVPGDVTEVTISIYSPVEPEGDSFFVNGVLVNVDNYDGGCTLTQGYWKTHGSEGPAGPFDPTWDILGEDTPFFLSEMSYYDAIREKAKGNAYYMLAHQYIAAKLNGLNGADFSDADDAFNDATALFGEPNNYTPGYIDGLKGNNPIRKQFIDAADILTDYNEGLIGPGHCDDGEEDDDKSVETTINSGLQDVVVYPNPMPNYGTLKFVAAENANTTVEVYNLVGTRVDMLFNDYVEAGSQTSLSIDANKYPKGMYIIYIRNGNSVYKEKLSIMN